MITQVQHTNQHKHQHLLLWVRMTATLLLSRTLLFGWAFVGYQIVIRPHFGVAGMLTEITGISGEIYGIWMASAVLIGLNGSLTRNKLLIAQIPAWLHCMLTLVFNYFHVGGNVFALPFPTYFSVCLSLLILTLVLDD